MPNICDYLDFRGDLTFAERAFNDADNLILATLSYVDFSGIVPAEGTGRAVTLAEACRELLAKAEGDIAPYVRSLAQIDVGFLERLARSRRFGQALLHDYVGVIDEDRSMQFAALQITFELGRTYVSFRGTDGTLVGWRENFVMSFRETGAQRRAADYLLRACKVALSSGTRLLAGGHSKGGNLASFAATKVPGELQPVLGRVYSNDGPEMAPDLEPASAYGVLGERYVKIQPTFSVVGSIFAEEGEPHVIVRSSASGVGQHDPMTWQVRADGLLEADDFEDGGKVVARAIRDWVSGVDLPDRERFTDELFDALAAGGATTLDEVATASSLPKVVSALSAADDRTKRIASKLVSSYVGSAADATLQTTRQTAGEALRRLLGEVGQ